MAGGNRSSRKRSKLTNTERVITPSLGRINNLPNEILCHILSFLPTKASVATSTLASRWRFLWTKVMSIHFHGNLDRINRKAFPDIVNRVLLLNTTRFINTFRFQLLHKYCNEYQFETWISAAVARSVQVLDISFDLKFMLPRCLFISTTLVECTLDQCTCLCTGIVSLPNLKKLTLGYIRYETEDSLTKLISGCLVLEELEIINTMNGRLFNISSPTIKYLSVTTHNIDYLQGNDYRMELNTPAVEYLEVRDHYANRISAPNLDVRDHFAYCISTPNLSSLAEVNIFLCSVDWSNILFLRSIFDFVESVSMVKRLSFICPLSLKRLSTEFSASTMKFHNLIKLEFGGDWRLLIRILESADKLENLMITEVLEERTCWRKPQKVPVCLLSCLQKVTIYPVRWESSYFKMVRYILRNAKFLKGMKIYINNDSDAKYDIHQKISLFRRASEACELAFFTDCDSDSD